MVRERRWSQSKWGTALLILALEPSISLKGASLKSGGCFCGRLTYKRTTTDMTRFSPISSSFKLRKNSNRWTERPTAHCSQSLDGLNGFSGEIDRNIIDDQDLCSSKMQYNVFRGASEACSNPGHTADDSSKPWSSLPGTMLVPLSLESVRNSLIRQEETIIFSLIEREQFRHNSIIYAERSFKLCKGGVSDIYARDATFLEYMLCETEKLHARVRRYMSPEELAFFPVFLPEPVLPRLDFPTLLAPNDVNLNGEILRRYTSEVVPMICEPGDDEQHGSSIICDINALQALSKRIHLGKFVAESKYQADRDKYHDLCKAGDVQGVLELLTNKAVEEKVLQRAFVKASTYGKDIDLSMKVGGEVDGAASGGTELFKVDPQVIADIYRDIVIPLTKEVEVLYLFQRTGYSCPSLESIKSGSWRDG